MTKTPDITIIGGGVIGLLTAREFFNAGATVTVIDKALLGQESSWAGGGICCRFIPGGKRRRLRAWPSKACPCIPC